MTRQLVLGLDLEAPLRLEPAVTNAGLTTDNVPLVIGAGSVESIRINPNGYVGINDDYGAEGGGLLRVRGKGEGSTTIGIQHVNAAGDRNIFYSRDDGYIYAQGPMDLGGGLTVSGNLAFSGDLSHPNGQPFITFGGEQLNWAATGGGFRWVNQGNSVQWMSLDTAGSLHVANAGTYGGSLSAYAGVWSNTFYLGSSGSYYINLSGNTMQCANMNLLSWGWVGLSANAGIYMHWNGTNIAFTHGIQSGAGVYLSNNGGIGHYWDGTWIHFTHNVYTPGILYAVSRLVSNNSDWGWANNLGGDVYCSGRIVVAAWDVGTTLSVGGTIRSSQGYTSDSGDLNLQAGSLRINQAGATIGFYGGSGISYGGNIGRPADWSYHWNSTYTYWDMDCGHDVHCAALYQSSRGADKQNKLEVSDPDALARVLDSRLSIITWDSVVEPTGSGNPEHRQTMMTSSPSRSPARQIGFTAEDMLGVVPEVVVTDVDGPSGIAYGNLTALLWGAMRAYVQQTDAWIAELESRLAALEAA